MPKRSKEFFDQMTEQSEVKTEIVRKYFWAWAKVISNQAIKRGLNTIAYVDLFAGPGRYNDGTPSTPILILEGAIRDEIISKMLVALFNDADRDNARSLEEAIATLPGIELLLHKPRVRNFEVDDALAEKFERWKWPTLFFIDPFGYKGLSLQLIRTVLKPWGSDCIFFFNYNRINAALSNPKFERNMNIFFGEDRAQKLRASLAGRDAYWRQEIIIQEIKEALRELGGAHSIEYYFKDDTGNKTSHFLIFASKHPLGYGIMKSIMGGESSIDDHGVPTYGFNPLDKDAIKEQEKAPPLFDIRPDPIHDLAEGLVRAFAGRTLTTQQIYHEHGLGKPFLLKNYQDALRRLEEAGRIKADPPASERVRAGKVTFSEKVVVSFPSKEG